MADPGLRTVHIRAEGRVQGVGYRAFVERHALDLGLKGWVRNRRNRSVEAVLQGAPAKVDEALLLCRSGPPGACVDRVEIIGEGVGAFDVFVIRPTT